MSSLKEHVAHLFIVRLMRLKLAVLEDAHDDGTAAVGAGMLSKVVGARELLATLVALEWLVLSVERAVVTLEVLLTTEPTGAECADKSLGGIFGQGLLASAAVG